MLYGLTSCLFFVYRVFQGQWKYPKEAWQKALTFSLLSTLLYYCCVILSLRLCDPAIATLISGITPIAVAFYGNYKERSVKFISMIPASLCIGLGLLTIHIPHIQSASLHTDHLLGLLFAFIALLIITWQMVENAIFLKKTPTLSAFDWATLMGLSTLFWTFCAFCFFFIFHQDYFSHSLTQYPSPFLLGSCILGCICSWVGSFLWTKATPYLPVSLGGHIMIFETLFALSFTYLLQKRLPTLFEGFGILTLCLSVSWALKALYSRTKNTNSPEAH